MGLGAINRTQFFLVAYWSIRELFQKQLAEAMGITQPTLSAIEHRGAEIKLSTLKRYIESMGGKLRLDVELPTGKHIGFKM